MTDSARKSPTLALLCTLCASLGFWKAGAFAAGNVPVPAEDVPPPAVLSPASGAGAGPICHSERGAAGDPKARPPDPLRDLEAVSKAPECPESSKKAPTTLTCPALPETVRAVQNAAAAALKTPVSATNSIGMRLVLVPAGEFGMGSTEKESGRKWDEGPQHRVSIKTAFYMGVCEVTQAQYELVMGTNPSRFRKPENPVECVSWKDAMEFCKKLSAKEKKLYRLPTEAEWEYACRAGSATRFWWGESGEEAGKYADAPDLTARKARPGARPAAPAAAEHPKTTPVGTFKPNALGLQDMIGNVWDWCQSLKKGYPYRADDGRENLNAAGHRVVRGGSWRSYPEYCRSAARYALDPTIRDNHVGFRVVRSAP